LTLWQAYWTILKESDDARVLIAFEASCSNALQPSALAKSVLAPS
jgi:hypothetical protein